MLLNNSFHEAFEMLIEFRSEFLCFAELGEFAVDCPNDFDVIVFNKLQKLLLILLRIQMKT